MLAAVSAYFNPCNYVRLRDNLTRFRRQWHGCPLYVIELAYDASQPVNTDSDWRIVGDRHKNGLWQKEALLNEAARRLPRDVDRVVLVDADMLFTNPRWATETEHVLDDVPICQPFERVHFLDSCGRFGEQPHLDSTAARLRDVGTTADQQRIAPGGAWALRRELLDSVGLYASHPLGSNDGILQHATCGLFGGCLYRRLPRPLNRHALEWSWSWYSHTRGRLGCVPGELIHSFHGTQRDRQYATRESVLHEHSFDPVSDVRINDDGLLEWSSDKLSLHQAVCNYFSARKEDD